MIAMSKIVRTVTNFLYAFIIMFGLYIIMHGHLTPGGGFQGGAVVGAAFALLIIAYGRVRIKKMLSATKFSVAESTGLLAFICLGFLGISTAFFYNFLAVGRYAPIPLFGDKPGFGSSAGSLNTAGVLPLMNLAVGMEVLAALGLIVLLMMHGSAENKGKVSK